MRFFAFVIIVFSMTVFTTSDAKAQCFVRQNVAVQQGFNFAQQRVIVPQSTAFFTGSRVAFVNQPFVNQPFVNQPFVNQPFVNQPVPVVQQIRVQRGLFGRIRRVQVQNIAVQQQPQQQFATINTFPTVAGRRTVFINGFQIGSSNQQIQLAQPVRRT